MANGQQAGFRTSRQTLLLPPAPRLFPDQQAAAQAAGRIAFRPQVYGLERPRDSAAALWAGQLSAGTRLAIVPLFDRGHDTQVFFELLTGRAGHAAQFNPSQPVASSRIIPLATCTAAGFAVSDDLPSGMPSAAFTLPPLITATIRGLTHATVQPQPPAATR